MRVRLSVCIPAYNRPEQLRALLDSIVDQEFRDFEIVICEDDSPCRIQIRNVVKSYQAQYPGLIQYHENKSNLGYDGNIRELFIKATGEYCIFMGNDDLLAEGALEAVAAALHRYRRIGVIMRSYATFDKTPRNLIEIHRYFESERYFPAGPDTVATFFRRMVVLSGLVIHRECALKYCKPIFEGTLLYQLYLTANVLLDMDGLFIPDVLALYRLGASPDFGNSLAERGKFTPGKQTPESSVSFVRGFLEIARHVDKIRSVKIYERVLHDMGNYAYPILAIQARQQPFAKFLRYIYKLEIMGFWRSMLFQGYSLCLLTFGPNRMDKLIGWIKKKVGYTPMIGKVFRGITRLGN
jgi:abequosyltransferase